MNQAPKDVDIHMDYMDQTKATRDYEVTLGGIVIGGGELALTKEASKVEISYLTINDKDMRGKGYGKAARAKLMQCILEDYQWAETVFSSIDNVAALKAAIATPVPEGWSRLFKLSSLNGEETEVVARFSTKNQDEALNWVEQNGPVGVYYVKSASAKLFSRL